MRVRHVGRFLEERIVIVPGAKLRRRDAAVPRQGRVQLRLRRPIRLTGQHVQLVEQRQHLLLALLVQEELHDVIILESQLAGVLVAQLHQPLQVRFHLPAHTFARFPGRLALGRILRRGQYAADLVVGRFPAVDHRPEDVKGLFHEVRFRQHLLEQFGIDLVGQIFKIEDLDLPPQERIGRRMRVDGLQLGKGLGIGELEFQFGLDFLLLAEVFVRAGDAGGPVPAIGLDLQRADHALVVLDEAARGGVAIAAAIAAVVGLGGHDHRRGADGQSEHQGRQGHLCPFLFSRGGMGNRTAYQNHSAGGRRRMEGGRRRAEGGRQNGAGGVSLRM